MKFLRAVLLLIGTTLGAGVFALPYFFAQSGLLNGIITTIILTLLIASVNWLYARIILITPGDHQLAGYARRYFGPQGFWLGFILLFLALVGAFGAYVILGGTFLALLLPIPPLAAKFVFLLLAFAAFASKLRHLGNLEGFLTTILIIIILAFPFLTFPRLHFAYLQQPTQHPFALYAPLLFALTGLTIIPEVEEVLRQKHQLLAKAIVTGTVGVAFLYLLFSLNIWALTGQPAINTLNGLSNMPPWLVGLIALAGFLSCLTSFLGLLEVMRELLYRDLQNSQKFIRANLLTLAIASLPLIFPIGWLGPIFRLTGAGAISGINLLVTAIYRRAARPSSPWLWFLAIAFLAGALLSF